MRYNCGGPDSPGGTHHGACDHIADELRREGAEAERRDVLSAMRAWAHHDYDIGSPAVLIAARRIERGEHLRGESEVAPRHAVNEHGDCAVWCHGCDWRKSRGLPLDWKPSGDSEGG